MDVKVTPVSTAEYTAAYPGQAKRPMNSRISKEKLSDNGFERLPSWQDAVGRYLKEFGKKCAIRHRKQQRQKV